MEWNCLCPPVHLCYNDEHLYLTCKEASTWNFSDRNALVCLFVCFLGEGLRQVLQLIILSAYCCSRTSSPLAHRQLGQAPAPRPPVQGQGGGMDSWVDGVHSVVDTHCCWRTMLLHSVVDTQWCWHTMLLHSVDDTVLLTHSVVDKQCCWQFCWHRVVDTQCYYILLLTHSVVETQCY